jgi:hypothetical protein
VEGVLKDSSAHAAGIRAGDELEFVDGICVAGLDDQVSGGTRSGLGSWGSGLRAEGSGLRAQGSGLSHCYTHTLPMIKK